MQATEQRLYGAQMRAADDQERIVEGRAVPFDTFAPINGQYLEAIAPGCFKRSVDRHGATIPLMLRHDLTGDPIGKPLEWRFEADGLHATWQLRDDDVYGMAKDGYLRGLSVGFQPIKSDIDPESVPMRITRKEARLLEVSVVPVGAFEDAQITLVRTQGPPDRDNRPRLHAWRALLEDLNRT